MTPPPINIDGTTENYSNVTIDGQDVEQITIDGQDVLSAIPDSVVWQTPFDEGSGSTAEDIIGSADGTITGATWKSDTGRVGDNYLSFDGDDDVNYGTPSVLDLAPQGSWTIEMAIRASNSQSFETYFAKAPENSGNRQYELRVDDSDNYDIAVGGNFKSSTTTPSESWEIIHLRNSSGSVDMFVDGTEIITDFSAGTGTTSADVFAGQRSDGSTTWSGDIDSPVVHDTDLTDTEISDRVSSYPDWI